MSAFAIRRKRGRIELFELGLDAREGGFIAAANRNARAQCCKFEGDSAADATAGAGDEGDRMLHRFRRQGWTGF